MVLVIVNAKVFVKNMVHAFRIYYCIEHKSNGIAAAIVVARKTLYGQGSTVKVNPYFGNLVELQLSSPDTSLSSPWVNDGLLLTEITS